MTLTNPPGGNQPPIGQQPGATGAPSPERTRMDTTSTNETPESPDGGQPSTDHQRGERFDMHRRHGHQHGHGAHDGERHGPGWHRGFGPGRPGGPDWAGRERDGDPDTNQMPDDGPGRRFMGFGRMHRHRRDAFAQAMGRGFGPGGPGGPGSGWGGPRGRRGFGGHGGPGDGRGGPWFGEDGPGRQRGERFFARGELRYVILDLVNDQPRHGYDIIRALEEQFSGLYSPSPGSVYPTLQLLEDQEFVVSEQQDGKKIFRATDAGRAELAKRGDTLQAIRDRIGARPVFEAIGDIRPIVGELWDLGQTVMRAASRGDLADGDRVDRLREAIRRARREIDEVLTVPVGDRPSGKPDPKAEEPVPPIM